MVGENNKVVIVTGGSSGIGRCTASALKENGCIVYEFSRRSIPMEGVTHLSVDVTDEDAVNAAVQQVIQKETKIDAVINCAGFGISGAVEFTSMEQAKAQFDVNFFGTVTVNKAVLPFLRHQGKGHIVNISSVAAVAHIPFQTFYSASKAAISSYSYALANEVKPYGIHVTVVELGDICTGFTKARQKSILGDDDSCVSIIDLSLVPTEITHLVTAVISRIVFESLQRYRRLYNKSLPTVLVAEEAHTFIKRYRDDSENQDVAAVCCQVFEKIAREGRKFGLGMVISSQRPSELSPTVLSQCNTFLLHRISNDKDQEQVHKMVPDNLRGLLRELPSLPSQHAILMGWASELPVLVKMKNLTKEQQPHSDDPDFWDVWTRKYADGKLVERTVDWEAVVKEWQQK
mgnify:CR=1 FL=1